MFHYLQALAFGPLLLDFRSLRRVMDEVFDIVDEADQVVGQALRADVHARSLLHRAVHVLVFNSRGETFIQRRSMLKDQHPGVWAASCAGHLDSGEDYDTAARREFAEELGVPAPALERVIKLPACAETGHEFLWIYRCRHEGPFQLNPLEIDEGRWLQPLELSRQIQEEPPSFASSFRHVWKSVWPLLHGAQGA